MRKPSGIALTSNARQFGLREWPGDHVVGRIFTTTGASQFLAHVYEAALLPQPQDPQAGAFSRWTQRTG
jgi:hypothetical protein